MRIAVTGGTGFVGHYTVAHLCRAGHEVTSFGRRRCLHPDARFAPFELGDAEPDLRGHDVLVHLALSHVPGRYRGGEGQDPDAFLHRNLDGTLRLFEAACRSGVGRIVFLSSRAVYGDYPPGTPLHEDMILRPDTLYGEVKARAEEALIGLAADGFSVAILRATGVYGPPVEGLVHKWAQVFEDYVQRRPIRPRAASEVHAEDIAEAVRLLAVADPAALERVVFNASDFVLDLADLLAQYGTLIGVEAPLPERADAALVSVMTTDRLRGLGWQPGGPSRVAETLRRIVGLS